MLTFSVNPEVNKIVEFKVNEKPNLTLEQVGNRYRCIDTEEGNEYISIEFNEDALSIKSPFFVNIRPFIYEISNIKAKEELFEVGVRTNERITSYTSNEQKLKICTNSSYVEFTIQNGVLVLKSDKYLSLDSEQNSLQMMKF